MDSFINMLIIALLITILIFKLEKYYFKKGVREAINYFINCSDEDFEEITKARKINKEVEG